MSASKDSAKSIAVQRVAAIPKEKAGKPSWNGASSTKAGRIAAAKVALHDGMLTPAEYAAMRQQIGE